MIVPDLQVPIPRVAGNAAKISGFNDRQHTPSSR